MHRTLHKTIIRKLLIKIRTDEKVSFKDNAAKVLFSFLFCFLTFSLGVTELL